MAGVGFCLGRRRDRLKGGADGVGEALCGGEAEAVGFIGRERGGIFQNGRKGFRVCHFSRHAKA